jgi:hypothetical protein
LTVVITVNAQKKIISSPDTIRIPLYNGFTIQADLASAATSAISTETYSYEAGIQVDLKHKYYPIFELGFAGANKTTTDNIGYITNAPFGKIGLDFNILKKKKDSKPTNNLFLAGFRFGMSNFNYRLTNVTITDNYWGGSEVVFKDANTTTKIWWEIVAGVRVEVVKNFYMGWTIRNKNLISQDVAGAVAPWYIPGFGINNASNWGFNYTLGYHF